MKINLADSGFLCRLALGKQQELEAILAAFPTEGENAMDPIARAMLEADVTILLLLAGIHAAKAAIQEQARGPIVLPHGVLRGSGRG